jgi:hypothetical protein
LGPNGNRPSILLELEAAGIEPEHPEPESSAGVVASWLAHPGMPFETLR